MSENNSNKKLNTKTISTQINELNDLSSNQILSTKIYQ